MRVPRYIYKGDTYKTKNNIYKKGRLRPDMKSIEDRRNIAISLFCGTNDNTR